MKALRPKYVPTRRVLNPQLSSSSLPISGTDTFVLVPLDSSNCLLISTASPRILCRLTLLLSVAHGELKQTRLPILCAGVLG